MASCGNYKKCGNPGRVNVHGQACGFCVECAVPLGLWKPGDHAPEEPEGFCQFWELGFESFDSYSQDYPSRLNYNRER
jgi:hypothetical protein